jgi:hypothetical protein
MNKALAEAVMRWMTGSATVWAIASVVAAETGVGAPVAVIAGIISAIQCIGVYVFALQERCNGVCVKGTWNGIIWVESRP